MWKKRLPSLLGVALPRPNLAGPAAGGIGEHGGGALLPRLVPHGLHHLHGPA